LAAPEAGFTSGGSCAGSRINFYNTTNPNGSVIKDYFWDFGDPTSTGDSSGLPNAAYTYPLSGEYDARLVVVNELGCSDTVSHRIPMHGSPKADFNFSLACLRHPVHFFDQSDSKLAPLTHSGWIITDGTHTLEYKSGFDMTYTFDSMGTYTVIHAISDLNGCSDSINYLLSVLPTPLSVFTLRDNFENVQGQIKVENGSLGAEDYFWEFGNGVTSYSESPLITYNEDGDYLIQLFAKNKQGCVDSTGFVFKMLFKGLWVPNALALGSESSVRVWKPIGVNLLSYRADVFDRWGNLIWHSAKLTEKGAPAEGWDGTNNLQPCQQSVYVWKITAIFRDGTIWRNDDVGNHDGLSVGKSGTITLVR
jgi:PKD repeat protein